MREGRRAGSNPLVQIDRGVPGQSARVEYERRRQADDRRRQERYGRCLGSVVTALIGPRQSTQSWERGSQGEARVGKYLDRAVGEAGLLLHDRAIPGTRSNIDHIAIVASGIWVIDTKQYRGRVQGRNGGGWFGTKPALCINGQNRTSLIPGVRRQAARVRQVVGDGVPTRPALCFADGAWGPLTQSFSIDGVTVTWPRHLALSLLDPGPLDDMAVEGLAQRIVATFPPYGGSGSSPG